MIYVLYNSHGVDVKNGQETIYRFENREDADSFLHWANFGESRPIAKELAENDPQVVDAWEWAKSHHDRWPWRDG